MNIPTNKGTKCHDSLSHASGIVAKAMWNEWSDYYWNDDKLMDFREAPVCPLADDSNEKKVLDMIVVLLAATGLPPKACEVGRALGIPDLSKTIVYMAIDSLRRKGFLAKKEDAERKNQWGKQANLIPLRQADGSEYEFRDWPVARKAIKRGPRTHIKNVQQKLL
jgi:hypothetical protein